MTEPRHRRPGSLALATILAGLAACWLAELQAADAPRVRDLRTQGVGDTTFFHVRFEAPADMQSVPVGPDTKNLTRQPRLVPRDGKTQAVYHRFAMPNNPGSPPAAVANQPPVPTTPVEGLEFVGTLHGEGPAKFLLLYPVSKAQEKLDVVTRPPPWAETPVELDFAKAKPVAVPAEAARRKPDQPPAADDHPGLADDHRVGLDHLGIHRRRDEHRLPPSPHTIVPGWSLFSPCRNPLGTYARESRIEDCLFGGGWLRFWGHGGSFSR